MSMRLGLGLGLPCVGRAGGAAAWTPANLFASGEEGAWYDPSDLATLWKDTAGTSPVTADGDSVARVDDKSGNGNHLIFSTASNRPLYQTGSDLHWLLFDGVDDGGSTAAIDFTGTDKMSAFLAARKASDHSGIICELSGSATTNRAFFLFSDASGAYIIQAHNKDSDSSKGYSGYLTSVYAGEHAAVLTEVVDFAGTTRDTEMVHLRVTGTDDRQTADGTYQDNDPNFGDYKLYVGSRNESTLPFDGRLYGLIVRGVQSSAAEIAKAESYLAGKAGVTL